MTKEELMEEVKRRYPIGCTVRDVMDSDEKVISDYENKWDLCEGGLYYSSNPDMRIYYNEKWAEIISYPKESSPLQLLFQPFIN